MYALKNHFNSYFAWLIILGVLNCWACCLWTWWGIIGADYPVLTSSLSCPLWTPHNHICSRCASSINLELSCKLLYHYSNRLFLSPAMMLIRNSPHGSVIRHLLSLGDIFVFICIVLKTDNICSILWNANIENSRILDATFSTLSL